MKSHISTSRTGSFTDLCVFATNKVSAAFEQNPDANPADYSSRPIGGTTKTKRLTRAVVAQLGTRVCLLVGPGPQHATLFALQHGFTLAEIKPHAAVKFVLELDCRTTARAKATADDLERALMQPLISLEAFVRFGYDHNS